MQTPSRRASPLESAWQRSTVLWMMLVAEGVAVILTLALGVAHPFRYLGAVSLGMQGILLATLGELFLLRRRLARTAPLRVANLVLCLLVLNACLLAGLTRFSFEPAVGLAPAAWGQLLLRLVGIVLVVGLLGLAAFRNYWRSSRMAVRVKQAELEALQARIRPHFLFNTLNTATALVHQRPEEAERLLLDLSDLFRAALAGPKEIPLAEELALVRRYLEIEQLRFGERLRVEWDLPRDIPKVDVPALSVQPLVENAIRHGVERVERGGRVEIALSSTVDHVLVRIRNPLVLGDAARPPSHQVGLSASQARIEALTGGRGSVETGVQGEHYVATVRLPRPRPANRRD